MNVSRLLKIVTLCLVPMGIYAQSPARQIKKTIKNADKAFERADYMKAYNYYTDVLKLDSTSVEAMYKSGLSLFLMDKTDTGAVRFFDAAKNAIPESHYYLGRINHLAGNDRRALETFYHFKSLNNFTKVSEEDLDRWIRRSERSIIEESEKEYYVVRNAGPAINTEFPEYVPLIWSLNSSMIFTSRRPDSKGGLLDPYMRYYEDIYVTKRLPEGWTKPVSISSELNTSTHDACVSFSHDGAELIIYRTDETQLAGDLYVTRYDSSKWSAPVKLGPEINSEYLEASACFSPDGNEIVFSSNRPGGYGGKDLYRCTRFMNGKFSLPHNLGPEVNSPEDDDAPFIDKDNTLYFASRGHDGMGEYDIFRANYNSSRNVWTDVENMGQPVNSTNDDIYFTKGEVFNKAWFASRRSGGYGDSDIYEVDFAESVKQIVYYKLVNDGLSQDEILDIQISLINKETGELEGLYNPGRSYLAAILLVTKNKPYELLVEGGAIEEIRMDVMFNENDKELKLQLKKL